MLTRYWFIFAHSDASSMLNLGCGITAYDRVDAERMLREKVFPMFGELRIGEAIVNIDVRTLEKNHVLPNIGNPAVRGIWYPASQ